MSSGTNVGRAYATIEIDDKMDSGMNSAKGKFSSFAGDMEGRAGKMGSAIGNALKVGLAVGVAAIGAALVGGTKAYMDYEQSLANVSKTVDGTAAQIKALGEQNRALADSTGIAVTSLNGVSATLGSLGVAYKDIAAVTDLVAKGSVAFGMNAETMATQVAKISTVYQIPIEQSGKYLSAMNALGNATAATEPEILLFTQTLGPLATAFNVPIEKVAAFGATLISSGVDATEGATSIRSAIEYAMADAKGTRMESWAKLLGTDVKDLNKQLNTDFLGTMAKSSAALDKIKSSTDKSKTAFDIWGSYGFKVMGTMSSQAGNLDKNLKVVYDDAAAGSKSMTQEFERQNNTLQGSWGKVMAGINDVGITIGEVTSGPVKGLFDAFVAGVPKIKEFTSALLGGDWGKVSEMLKTAFDAGIAKAKDLFSQFGSWIGAQPWAQWFAKAGDGILNQPWGSWASKAIDLLGQGARAAINGAFLLGDWIHDKLQNWIDGGGPRALGQSIADAIISFFKQDTSIADQMKNVWGTVTEWAGIGWKIVSGIAQGLLDRMYNAVQPSANKLLAAFATSGYEIQGVFAKTWNAALIGAANLVEGIRSAFSKPIEIITNFVGSAASYVESGASSFNAAAAPAVNTAVGATTAVTTAVGLGTSTSAPAGYQETYDYDSTHGGFGGYRTGGKGFISSELQNAGDGKLYMITDKGDFVTLSGKETVAKSVFDLIAPYTADYVTNSKEAGQAWADKVMPVGDKIVSSEDKASATQKEAATAAAQTTKLASESIKTDMFGTAEFLKSMGQSVGNSLSSAGDKVNFALSSASQNALTIGNAVSAKFQGAGDAVRIGMDSAGRQIAVIGSVAQAQFSAAGGQFSSTIQGGASAARSTITAGASSIQTAGSSLLGSAQAGANSLYNAAGAVNASAANMTAALANNPVWNGSLWNNGNSGTSGKSSTGTTSSGSGSSLDGWGGKPKGMATGSITTGPQFAMIGEDGPNNPEYVIPTKTKRWDLLLAAMRAYGIPGYATGTATGVTGGAAEGDAPPLSATFGISGLAQMSKGVQKIINDLKDFFRISWGIIKSEASTYWKSIEKVITDEVTIIRDAAWQGALDVRNTWISSNAAILADATDSYKALWPAISPSIVSIHDGMIASFTDSNSQVKSLLDQMASDAMTSLSSFQVSWTTVWAQLLADLSSTSSQISSMLSQIAAQVGAISVNVNVGGSGGYSNGGSGSGGGSSPDEGDMGSGSTGNGGLIMNPDGSANYITKDCFGRDVLVNALKYTAPNGKVSYFNPMNGGFGAGQNGASAPSSSGGSGGSYGGFTPTTGSNPWAGSSTPVYGNSGVSVPGGSIGGFFSADGAVFEKPSVTHIAEEGIEMVLPTKLTRMFMSMADAGLGQGATSGSGRIVIEDHTEHHWYMDGKEMTKQIMRGATKQMKLRGAIPTR